MAKEGLVHPHQHAVWLHELWQTWSWHGKWIWSGDWNQTKGEADVVEVASIFGGHYHYVPENDDTTRGNPRGSSISM